MKSKGEADMNNEVTDLIEALRGVAMSLEDVAQRFRERSWPRRRTPEPQTSIRLAAAAQQIPNRTCRDPLMMSLQLTIEARFLMTSMRCCPRPWLIEARRGSPGMAPKGRADSV